MAGPGEPRVDLAELIDRLVAESGRAVTALRRFPARPAQTVPFPVLARPPDRRGAQGSRRAAALLAPGAAVEIVAKGENVVVVTPTASGKTLCYNLPVLQAPGRAARGARPLPVPDQGPRPGPARGAEGARRDAARHADVHLRRRHAAGRAALGARARQPRADQPRHAALGHPAAPHEVGDLFQSLRYVVIDELHAYRGVFGSHLANVLRRLKRICRHYGATPQFIMASATIANPRELAERLTGEPVSEVAESGAPTGEKSSSATTRRWSTPSSASARRIWRGGQARDAASQEADRHDRLRPEPAGHRGRAGHHQGGGGGRGRLRDGARIPGRLPAAAPARGRAGAALGRGAGRGDDERARAGDRHRASGRGGPRRVSRYHRLDVAAGGARGPADRAVGGGDGGATARRWTSTSSRIRTTSSARPPSTPGSIRRIPSSS